MEHEYFVANLSVFFDSAAADIPIAADLQLERHETRARDDDGPGYDHVKTLQNLDVSVDEPLLSDPRWEEINGRDDIEDRANDQPEAGYWLRYQVSDGWDVAGDPTYACRDWILPIFEKAKKEEDPK